MRGPSFLEAQCWEEGSARLRLGTKDVSGEVKRANTQDDEMTVGVFRLPRTRAVSPFLTVREAHLIPAWSCHHLSGQACHAGSQLFICVTFSLEGGGRTPHILSVLNVCALSAGSRVGAK